MTSDRRAQRARAEKAIEQLEQAAAAWDEERRGLELVRPAAAVARVARMVQASADLQHMYSCGRP